MLGHRVRVGFGVFGVAALCALVAIYWSRYWVMTGALWFGAAAFVVLGFRTLLGRVGRPELRDPPWPAQFDPVANPLVLPGHSMPEGQTRWEAGPSPASWNPPPRPAAVGGRSVPGRPPTPDEPSNAQLTDAVVASGKQIVQGMWHVVLVLSLLVLVPVTLFAALIAVLQFRDGQVVNGFFALGIAGLTGGFAANMIRHRKSPSLSIEE